MWSRSGCSGGGVSQHQRCGPAMPPCHLSCASGPPSWLAQRVWQGAYRMSGGALWRRTSSCVCLALDDAFHPTTSHHHECGGCITSSQRLGSNLHACEQACFSGLRVPWFRSTWWRRKGHLDGSAIHTFCHEACVLWSWGKSCPSLLRSHCAASRSTL